MNAFIVAHSTIHDPEKFQAYAQAVPATLLPFRGEIALRGKLDHVLTGEFTHKSVAILQFPDHAALDAWYNSPEYQALIELPDAGADMVISTFSKM